jgi:hypothetical protein
LVLVGINLSRVEVWNNWVFRLGVSSIPLESRKFLEWLNGQELLVVFVMFLGCLLRNSLFNDSYLGVFPQMLQSILLAMFLFPSLLLI